MVASLSVSATATATMRSPASRTLVSISTLRLMTYPDALVANVHREVGVVSGRPPPRFNDIEVMGQLAD